MIINILLALIVFAAFVQPHHSRSMSALVVILVTLTFDFFFGDLQSGAYFIGAAMADLLIITLLFAVPNPVKMVFHLVCVNLAFIVVNLFGYLMWFYYQPPIVYVTLCIVLYIITIIAMVLPDGKEYQGDEGADNVRFKYDCLYTRFYSNFRARRLHGSKDGG